MVGHIMFGAKHQRFPHETCKKILDLRRLKSDKVNAKKQATRICPLPQGSTSFVKKSWDEWC